MVPHEEIKRQETIEACKCYLLGTKKVCATPRLVSFRGLIQIFQQASSAMGVPSPLFQGLHNGTTSLLLLIIIVTTRCLFLPISISSLTSS